MDTSFNDRLMEKDARIYQLRKEVDYLNGLLLNKAHSMKYPTVWQFIKYKWYWRGEKER